MSLMISRDACRIMTNGGNSLISIVRSLILRGRIVAAVPWIDTGV